MTIIGTLAAVRRYPFKSLRGEALDAAEVSVAGIPGDRAGALFARDGARAGKTYRGKENDRLHLTEKPQEAAGSAAVAGVEVELRRGEHFFDAAPISVLIDTWLEELSAYAGYPVQWERFRPNLFVRAHDRAPLELAIVGEMLRLGTARLRVRSPIERCVTVTYHPSGEASDPRILRYLARQRDACMGIYCDVLDPGVVRVGDLLTRE